MVNVHFTEKSRNGKTGPMPVSMTSAETCPPACPFNKPSDPMDGTSYAGCYAANSHLGIWWRRVTRGEIGLPSWELFCRKIEALPEGTLWRHNQAGDLPGQGNAIDGPKLARLVRANKGRKGFTYTHKPLTADNLKAIANANAKGFTVNLSANNLSHVDELANAAPGQPIVVVLPSHIEGNAKGIASPEGRRVVVCPATYRDDVTCQSCGLCAVASRLVVVGFPAHGATRAKASAIASE